MDIIKGYISSVNPTYEHRLSDADWRLLTQALTIFEVHRRCYLQLESISKATIHKVPVVIGMLREMLSGDSPLATPAHMTVASLNIQSNSAAGQCLTR